MLSNLLSCWLPWLGLWVAIFKAPTIPHLFELFTKIPTTTDDVEMWLLQQGRYRWLQLYTCVWCQAFWVSAAAGVTLALVRKDLVWAVVYALSYYPLTAYCAWKLDRISEH